MGRTFTSTDNGNAGSGTAVDALGGSAFTQIHLIRRLTTDASNQVIACKPFAGATGHTFLIDNSPAAGCLRLRVCRATTNTDYISDTGSAIAQNTTQWVAAVYGSGSASRILKRGLAAGAFTEIGYSLSQAGSGAYNADNSANLLIGNSAGGTTPFSGNIYVSAFFPSALTNAEIQEWADKQRPSMFSPTAWWYIGLADPEADQSGNGITLDITGTSTVADVETPYVITSGQIADTETVTDQTNYLKYSAGGRIEYTLGGAATEVDVAFHNTYDSATFGGEDAVGVWHKAANRIVPRYLGTIYAGGALGGAASGATRGSLTGLSLASGDKITLIAGCRQKTGLTGTWPVTARFWNSTTPATATVTTPTTPDLRTVIVGYSTLLEGASPSLERSWPIRYRLADGNEHRVMLDQKGGLSLFDEGVDASARTTYANRLAAFNARLYVMDHGDFVTNQQSAANYQTALQDLCEKLLAATPTTTKILLYQVHILQSSDETVPNSFGNVVEDYRVAIRNVVSTIGNSRLVTIDHSKITPWSAGSDTTDGRHPNDGGHIKIYDFTVGTIQRLLNLAPGLERVRALDLPLPLRLKWYPRRDESRSGAIAAGGGTTDGDATGSVVVTGTAVGSSTAGAAASGSVVCTGAAVGSSTAAAAGTASIVVTGASVGAATAAADAAGAIVCTGVAVGSSTAASACAGSVVVTGAAVGASTAATDATGTIVVSGSGVGATTAAAGAAGSVVVTGSAIGSSVSAATATGSVVVTGATVGEDATGSTGAATGSVVVTGAAVGSSIAAAVASGSVVVSGAAVGGEAGADSGTATGSVVVTGSAVGASTAAAGATGSVAVTGVASGAATATGVAVGSVVVAGSAVGVDVRWGAGAGSVSVTGASVGSTIATAVASGTVAVGGTSVGASTAASAAAGVVVITGAAIASSITPPDPPTVTAWTKTSGATTSPWATTAPVVTSWTKNEATELPIAA